MTDEAMVEVKALVELKTVLLTPEEVAGRLGVSRPQVYTLMRQGLLLSVSIGRSRRISLQDLADFIHHLRLEHASGESVPEMSQAVRSIQLSKVKGQDG